MKLHVGCWTRRLPGYIHIDNNTSIEGLDYYTDAHNLHMIKSGSCSIVYLAHVLEYYDWKQAKELVLPEWNRVLRRGGILRLAVPDFEKIIKLYSAGFDLSWFIGPLYGRMEVQRGNIYHRCVYDEKTLTSFLVGAGFKNIRRWDWKDIDPTFDDHSRAYIPHKEYDRGILISLNLEAEKT